MEFKFNYTRLYVGDYKTCLKFYRDILGLKVTFASEIDTYIELTDGATKLTLLNRNKIPEYFGSDTPVSFGHKNDAIALSFHVEDVDKAFEYLCQQGVEIVSKPWDFADWGVKLALVRDPEGNLIELNQLAQMVGAE
ncbi:VOC family protein [Myxosarcina sp. GI1(2024)]